MFTNASLFDHVEDEPRSQEEPYEKGLMGLYGNHPHTGMKSNPCGGKH